MKIKLQIFTLAILLVGCTQSSKINSKTQPVDEDKQFAEMINQYSQKNFPVPVFNGAAQISKVYLEDKYLTCKIDYKPEFFNIEAYKNAQDKVKDLLYLSFFMLNGQDQQGDLLSQFLSEKGYGVRVIFSNGISSFSTELTPSYIQRMKQKVVVNPHEALHDALSLKLEIESATLPMPIDYGINLNKIYLENENIVYEIVFDENYFDFDLVEEVCAEMTEIILEEGEEDPEIAALLTLCKISHSGLIYRYKGSISGNATDAYLSSEKIRREINTPEVFKIN